MLPLAEDDLLRSGITPAIADSCGIFDTESARDICADFRDLPALCIPYYDAAKNLVSDTGVPFVRVRYLGQAVGFTKLQRYAQPKNTRAYAYFPPIIGWGAICADPKEPIVITEGEKKAVCGAAHGIPTVALGGVYSWGRELLPELAKISWAGRDVYISYDSDAATNPQIVAAEARLTEELHRRGATVYLVRIPSPSVGGKAGIDDYIVAHGAAAYVDLLKSARPLSGLESKIVALNARAAFIEKENSVFDLEERTFLSKDCFTNGHKFSALKHIAPSATAKGAPKEISVARTWLVHPRAQRYAEVLFRPGEPSAVQTDNGGAALNLWRGWGNRVSGDVAPFLTLSKFLFSRMYGHEDLPLKLLAYKAQNPAKKVPLALVLLSLQGSGKTLWCECVHDAFAPYNTVISSKSFRSEFQGWLEKSLLAIINEAEDEDMLKGKDILKSLISDMQRPMNEKYRPVRQIRSYAMYILNANSRAVGSFSADDRRMIVIDCPNKSELGTDPEREEFFRPIVAWRHGGGPKHLLDWFLSYDLKGWTPPDSAPMTPEKYMAYMESLTAVQALAEEMKTADETTVKLWLDNAAAWAVEAETSNVPALAAHARATLQNIDHIMIRPWYEPRELAMIFPYLIESRLGAKYDSRTTPGKISRELRDAGIPYLVCADNPRGFKWQGTIRQYLVVHSFADWRRPLTQADFERAMGQWKPYGELRGKKRALAVT